MPAEGLVCPWCFYSSVSVFDIWCWFEALKFCFLGLLGVNMVRYPWLQDLLDLLILPWWLLVVLHFYFLLKCEGESFFIR
jgi:hypothetical protein